MELGSYYSGLAQGFTEGMLGVNPLAGAISGFGINLTTQLIRTGSFNPTELMFSIAGGILGGSATSNEAFGFALLFSSSFGGFSALDKMAEHFGG